MTTKEYFPGIGKIPFEGKESKNPMAFHYYNAEKVIRGKTGYDFPWLGGIPSVQKEEINSEEEPNVFPGMLPPPLYKGQKIKWMPDSSLCKNAESGTIVSTISIW